MRFRHTPLRPLPLVIALQAAFAVPAYAQFVVTAGQTDTAGKTLTNTNGSVAAGGALLVSGSTVAVTVGTGTSTIDNAGTIRQTGTARGIDLNANSTNLTLNNSAGALIDAVGDVTLRVNKASDSFVINNQGTISQSGVVTDGKTYAIKTNVIFTTTGNQIINGSASNTNAVITSSSSSAIKMGANTTLTNYGQIYSTSPVNTSCPDYLAGCSAGSPPKAGDGVSIDDAMKNAVILNHGAITGSRHGVDGGDPVSAAADADLIGVDQLIVTGIAANGVTFDKVVNGVTTSNVQVDNPVVINYAGGTLTGNNGSGVGFDGHGVVINYGTISGKYAGAGKVYNQLGLGTTNNGDGDGVDIDGVAYIENYGVIQGLGAGGLDSGGQPNGADGIAAGGGTIINHANATIYGQSHAILIDDGADGTAVASGRGTSTATGAAAKIINDGNITAGREVAIGLVGNFNDTIVNNASGIITGGPDTVRVGENNSTAAGAAIQMGDGDDSLTNYGRIEGKNGLAIDMGNGNDTLSLYGGTVIGTIDGGSGTNTLQTNGIQVFESGKLSNFQNIAVQGGSTTFNYALGTVNTVDIANAATLRVNGAFGTSGNLNVNGTLQAPASGAFRTIQVGGNYTQGASGVLEARIGANGASDQLAVTGNATLADGATIRPLLTGAVSDGAAYTLVTAGSMTANAGALQVDNGNGLFFSYTLQGSGNDLQLVAHQNKNIANTVPAGLGTLASALSAAVGAGLGNSEDGIKLVNALQSLPNTRAVSEATAQLAPENNAQTSTAAFAAQGSLFNAFGNRIDAVRSGEPASASSGLSGGDATGKRFWIQGLASVATQKERNGANGYDLDSQGIAVGFESDLDARDMIGASIGYTKAGVDGRDSGSGDNNDIDAFHIGGYFSRTDKDYTLDASLAVSSNHYDATRRVTMAGFSEDLKGRYSGYQIGGRVEYGIPFTMNDSWSGRWLVGGRFAYLNNGSYTESGGAAAQHVDGTSPHSVQSVLGAEFTNRLSASSSATLRARYLYEFADTPAVEANFASGGPSFRVEGAQPGRNTLELGVGYRKVTAQGTIISVGYDLQAKDKYLGHQLSARANWNF